MTSKGLQSPEDHARYKAARWLLVTYATAAKNIRKIRELDCDLVMLDECHKVNNEHSLQSRNILTLDAPVKLALSGSPFRNKRLEMFPVLNWLFPETFVTSEEFYESFCKTKEGIFSLQHELRSRMVCRFQDQVMKLPKVHEHRDEVAFDAEGRAHYDRLQADFVSWLVEHGRSAASLSGTVAFRKLHALRRAAITPKIPAIVELVHNTTEKGGKIVLYTTYLNAATTLRKELSAYKPLLLEGRSSSQERKKMIEDFHERDNRRVFIVTSAGAESIDLTPASTVVFVNLPYTWAERDQMLKRLQRRGQTRVVQSHTFVTTGTVDERLEALVQAKGEEHNQLLRINPALGRFMEESEKDNVRELVTDFLENKGGKQ